MKRKNKIMSVFLAAVMVVLCVPVASHAEEPAGGDVITSETFTVVDEYDSENGATGELIHEDDTEPPADTDETGLIAQAAVEAGLELAVGAPETADVYTEEEIAGDEVFLDTQAIALDDLVPAASFQEEPDDYDTAAEEGEIQTDFSSAAINVSSVNVRVNVGNTAKITFTYAGYTGSVNLHAEPNTHFNAVWGRWNNHKIELTIKGRMAGQTVLTVQLKDRNLRVLAEKEIRVTVTNTIKATLQENTKTLLKGENNSIGVKISGAQEGLQPRISVKGGAVDASVDELNVNDTTLSVKVKAKEEGRSQVKFYLYDQNNTLITEKTAEINVIKNPGVRLSQADVTVDVGGQTSVTVTPYNVGGNYHCECRVSNGCCTFTWGAWSNGSAPLVISGKKPGGAAVTVSVCDNTGRVLCSRTLAVTVRENPVIFSSMTDVSVQIGSYKNVVLFFKGLNSAVSIKTANSNKLIAAELGRVNANTCTLKITGCRRGTSVVTAYLCRENGDVAASCTINVTVTGEPEISLSAPSVTMRVGEQTTVEAAVSNMPGRYTVAYRVNGSSVACSISEKFLNNTASLILQGTKEGDSTVTLYLKDEQGIVVSQKTFVISIRPAGNPKITTPFQEYEVKVGLHTVANCTIGGYSGKVYVTAQSESGCVSYTWGPWESGTGQLYIQGQEVGDTQITLKLFAATDDTLLAERRFNVAVYPEIYSDLSRLSYHFENYEDTVPKSLFIRAFGDNTRTDLLYKKGPLNSKGEYFSKGFCYGMSVSSVLMENGASVSPAAFGRSSVYALWKKNNSEAYNMNVDTFIKWMQISWMSTIRQNTISDDLNSLIDYIKNGNKAVVNVRIPDTEKTLFGTKETTQAHSVVGYRFDDVHNRLYVYDPNWPMQEKYIDIMEDENGNYTGWLYNIWAKEIWGAPKSRTSISYQTLAGVTEQFENRENLIIPDSCFDALDWLILRPISFSITDVEGNTVATYANGELNCEEGAAYLLSQKWFDPNEEEDAAEDSWVVVALPTGFYTVHNEDPAVTSFHADMVNVELGVSVETEADEISFGVDDAYDLCTTYIDLEPGEAYEVELLSSREGERDITVSGVCLGDEPTVLGLGLENGECVNLTDANATVNVDGAFINGYTVTARAGEGGTISPAGAQPVLVGESATYTISAGTCHEIQDVLVNGESVGAVDAYTFHRIDADAVIEAVFAENEDAHVDTVKERRAPTCTEAGYTLYECAACGRRKTERIAASGHDLQTAVIKPTCTEGGYTLHACKNCDYSYTDAATAPAGHRFEQLRSEATCTQDGYTVNKCADCGKEENRTAIPAQGHADANNDGVCDSCGARLSDAQQEDPCPYCHKAHTGPMAGVTGFFHKIMYFFLHLFGKM